MLREMIRKTQRRVGAALVKWGWATPPRPRSILERESHASLREEADVPGGAASQDFGFRRLSSGTRDLSPVTQDRAQKASHYLWTSNPVAHRALKVIRNLIVAEGWTPQATAKDPQAKARVQKVLDTFWNDPVNNWDTRLPERILELLIFGEQPWRQFTRDLDGRVRLGLILPENIANVHADPDNAEQLTHLELKTPIEIRHPDGRIEKREFFEIIRRDENPHSPTYGKLVGEIFFWSINRLSGATRGLPMLLPVLDWIDMLEQLLYSETERAQLSKSFVYDVLLKGADENAIKDFIKRNRRPPKAGSIKVHNENEEWKVIAPSLQLKETIEYIRFLLLWIMGGLGIPEHYFSEANTVNKASAEEMSTPVFAEVRTLQKQIKDMFEVVLLYVVQEAVRCGRLAGLDADDLGVQMISRDPERKGYETAGTALDKLGAALANATMAEWISNQEAARCFRNGAGALGVQLDDDNDAALLAPAATGTPSAAVLQQIGKSGGGGGLGGQAA